MSIPSTPLAIIGIGCLFPKANGLGAYWSLLKNGVDAITPIPATHWNPADYFDADPKKPDFTYAQRGGFLEPYPFPPGEFGIAPNDIEATDTSQLLGMVAARMALDDAGYGVGREFDRNRVSVILGVTGTLELVVPLGARLGHPRWRQAMQDAGVPEAQIADAVQRIGESYVGWQENSFPGLLGNVVAGRIANRLDLGGTNCVVDAACASSLSAVHLAGMELATGRSDMVVSGGVDTFNDIFMYMCFSKTPALSPTGDARPFAANGDGTILGEGLGMVVLKRLADAERDGDRIYAVIKGVGSSSDGKGNAIYAPSAEGQVRCLEAAYRQADISPATIDLVEAHGTGTKVGDAIEIQALTQVFSNPKSEIRNPKSSRCALGSVKSQIGHTKAAAGAAGLIKAALALYHKVMPPTIKADLPAESLTATSFYLNTIKRPWLSHADHPRRAAVSAFGFGGSNFHCVLEEHRPEMPAADWDGDVQIIALSSDTLDELKTQLDAWSNPGEWDAVSDRAADSRTAFRSDAEFRLILVVQKGTNFQKLFERATDSFSGKPKAPAAISEGVYFGHGPVAGKIGALFPGQGSQYVGMLRDLACQFPAMQSALADGNSAGEQRLSDRIYPPPANTPDAKSVQEKALRATNIAQPAIGAVSLGAFRLMESFGFRPDAAAGHSYGELTALCAAGCFDTDSFHELSRLRGHLMANVSGGDPGSMLAVHADVANIESILRDDKLNVVIANRNAPAQTVLSGSTPEIDRAATAFSNRSIRVTRLPVAAAFHSPLVADAAQPFREELEKRPFAPPRFPVFANTTGQPYSSDAKQSRDMLGGQLAKPVEFVRTITEMLASGARTFVEIGPGNTLTRLVEAILKEQDAAQADVFALDASAGKRSGTLDLAHVLARLAARGHPIRLSAWEENPAHPRPRLQNGKQTLTIPICGANYVKPRPKRLATTIAPSTNGKSHEPIVPPKLEKPRIAPVADTPQKPTQPTPTMPPVLQLAREGLTAFQQLQQQTAELHRQFLQGQETAQQALNRLIEQQQQLMLASLGAAPFPSLPPIAVPAVQPPPAAVAPISKRVDFAPPPVVVPPSAPASANSDRVQNVLLTVVAEKTGYPAEMLDLDMGLDADLGIDSIKRVEILSTLQERLPDAPVVKPEHLGTLNTLRQIVGFLSQQSPAVISAPVPKTSERPVSDVQRVLLEVVSEKTGYPIEMLDPNMGLDADLGIDSIKRVEILSTIQERLPEAPAVKPEHLGTLNTLSQIVTFLSNGHSTTELPEKKNVERIENRPLASVAISRRVPTIEPASAASARPVVSLPHNGTIWIIAKNEPLSGRVSSAIRSKGHQIHRWDWSDRVPSEMPHDLCGLILLAPPGDLPDDFGQIAFRWLRGCGPALRRQGSSASSLVRTITRLGGNFGLNGIADDCDPIAGGLAGLAKTARHEWPEIDCRALDFAPAQADSQRVASMLIDEIFHQGPPEVGITAAGPVTVALVENPVSAVNPKLFGTKDVIVVSGGARGVTAEAAVAFAKTFRSTLVLLGRSPTPSDEPDWLSGLKDEVEIKRRIGAKSTGASPKEIGRKFRDLMAGREIRDTLVKIQSVGAKAAYRAVDVRDGNAVGEVLAEVRNEFGPITGLVHGAGVIEDRLIEDKTDEQFARVYGTKVDGLRNLLQAMRTDPLRAIALFSSSTGRFGRVGQVDYAVANEVLNKIAQREAKRRPGCRVVAINWGPWEGGMVSPSLAKVFQREGVGLIPLQEGSRFLLSELSDSDGPVEVVAGVWTDRDPNVAERVVEVASAVTSGLMTVFEKEISVERVPLLASHVIGGKAVFPFALHIEWLAHAAMHGNPGLNFHGLNDARVLNGIILAPGETRTVRAAAGKSQKRDGLFFVAVELLGIRPDGREIVHSRAEIVLASNYPLETPKIITPRFERFPSTVAQASNSMLFHGSDLRGILSIEGVSDDSIAGVIRTAPEPSQWFIQPVRQAWLADPLIIDGAFQLMILWGVSRRGEPNLPAAIGKYRQYRRSFPGNEIRVIAKIIKETGHLIRADLEFLDTSGSLVARLQEAEFVGDRGLQAQFGQNRLTVSVG